MNNKEKAVTSDAVVTSNPRVYGRAVVCSERRKKGDAEEIHGEFIIRDVPVVYGRAVVCSERRQ